MLNRLSALLAAAAVLLCAACGGDDAKSSQSGTDASPQPVAPAATPTPSPVGQVASVVQLVTSDSSFGTLPADSSRPVDPSRVSTAVSGYSVAVAFALAPAPEPNLRTAWVEVTLKSQGRIVARRVLSARMGGWSSLTLAPEDGWKQGEYEVTAAALGATDAKRVSVTYTPAALGAPPPARVQLPAAPAKFEHAFLLSNWGCVSYDKPNLSPAGFQDGAKTTFRTWDSVAVLYSLLPNEDSRVTLSLKHQGKPLGEPIETGSRCEGSVRSATVANPPLQGGEYELTMSVEGDTRTLKFTVGPMSPAPGKFDQVGLVTNSPQRTAPSAGAFARTYDVYDVLYPAFTLASGADVRDVETSFTYRWSYHGTEVKTGQSVERKDAWLVAYTTLGSSFAPRLPLPLGKYEFSVTNRASNETKTVAFELAETGKAPTPTPAPRAVIQEAGMAEGRPGPTLQANFATTFDKSAARLDAVFVLSGAPSRVTAHWEMPDGVLDTGGQSEIAARTRTALSIVPPQGGAFTVGEYTVTLTAVASGETKVLKFTVK